MKLTKVKIVDFLSIKLAEVEFDFTCRILVGINESGKSNILKAVSLLDPSTPVNKACLREVLSTEAIPKESKIDFSFEFEDRDLIEILESVKQRVLDVSNEPIIDFDGKRKNLEDFVKSRKSVLYRVDILKETKTPLHYQLLKGTKILNNFKKVSPTCPTDYEVITKDGDKYILCDYKFINIDNFEAIDPTVILDIKDEIEINQLLGNIQTDYLERNLPKVIFWQYKDVNLLPSRINLDSFIGAPENCVPLARMFNLAGIPNEEIITEVNAVKALTPNRLSTFLKKIADKNTVYFRKVWREYPDVSFELRTDGPDIVAVIKDTENTFELNQRSDGFKRFITFLLFISTQSNINSFKNSILIVDEPEISLHPTGVRFLRDELLEIAKNNIVLYSTHSIFMIDEKEISRHYIVKKESEVTQLEVVEESNIQDEEVIYKSLGYSIFSNLKDWNLIFEGWRDKDLFIKASALANGVKKKIFKEFNNVGYCHSQGVKHIHNITPAFEAGNRKCLILSDADEIAKDKKSEYEGQKGYGFWYTYHDFGTMFSNIFTAEDFFTDQYFLEKLKEITTRNSYPEFLTTDFISRKGKIDSLRAWYGKNSITKEKGDEMMGELKTALLEDLTLKDIDQIYYEYLTSVSQELKKLKAI